MNRVVDGATSLLQEEKLSFHILSEVEHKKKKHQYYLGQHRCYRPKLWVQEAHGGQKLHEPSFSLKIPRSIVIVKYCFRTAAFTERRISGDTAVLNWVYSNA